jgi:Tol biopolymer transport system component
LVLAAGVFLPQGAQAQYFGQNKVQYRQYDWHSIQSDHFEVYFYPELDSLALRVLDLAEKTNTYLSARMGHELTHRVPIILYGSHNDFEQTNVTPEILDAGTGGFTEMLRNRVVLPFTGAYEDLRHVVVHELTHAFMFDMLYGGAAGALLARQSLYQAPLWFAEGLAEYESLGMESNAEMFLRDGTVEGYLPPLPYSGGYIVYKQGQSAISYLVERYGDERLRDLLRRMRQMHSFDHAFQRALGVSQERFDEQWRQWLRKRYWPTVASKQQPEEFARRLTDHRRDQSYVNGAPAISPQGDRVAFVSDRRQYTDVYLMSAYDGRMLRRLIRGERNVQFEAIPSFRAALTWSPDGQRLALVARGGGHDILYVVSASSGRVLRSFDLGCPTLSYPAWSPRSDSVAVVGAKGDRSDIYMVNVKTKKFSRITNDLWDEMELTWRPDGRAITFASDRAAPVVLQPQRRVGAYGGYGIFELDLGTGLVSRVVDTGGEDHSPAWCADGTKLAFVSDRSGTPNIYLYDLRDTTTTQLTDVEGGVTSLSWSRVDDRLVFAAYNRAGVDIFEVREALSLDPVLQRLQQHMPQAVVNADSIREALPDSVPPMPSHGALATVWPDSVTATPDTMGTAVAENVLDSAPHPVARDSLGNNSLQSFGDPQWETGQPTPWVGMESQSPLPTHAPLLEHGGPFAVPDSVLSQRPSKYRGHLSPDYAGGGFYASTLGVIGQTQFAFSDFLGNHSLFLSADLVSDNLAETNALIGYNYLPRRTQMSLAVFHFKNYYSSEISPLGEHLGTPRLFAERNYGAVVQTAYPFDRFRRLELGYTQMFVERTFYGEDALGQLYVIGHQYPSVSAPSVSLVNDNTLNGWYGPVNGQRSNFTYTEALPLVDQALEYRTFTYDTRHYWDLTRGNTLATRGLVGRSDGNNPQTFQIGGFSTLRGYPDYSILGSRVMLANLEFRFPFIQQLGVVGPLPLGLFNLRGVGFLDLGSAWYAGTAPPLTVDIDGHRRLSALKMGFGTGIRTTMFFMIFKLDAAWRTDLVDVSQPRWMFSIGPEF